MHRIATNTLAVWAVLCGFHFCEYEFKSLGKADAAWKGELEDEAVCSRSSQNLMRVCDFIEMESLWVAHERNGTSSGAAGSNPEAAASMGPNHGE